MAGRPVSAFVPVSLEALEPLSTAAVRGAALVEGALTAIDRLHSGLEVPARLLLRVEGVASSRIEEIHAPAAEIASAGVLKPASALPRSRTLPQWRMPTVNVQEPVAARVSGHAIGWTDAHRTES